MIGRYTWLIYAAEEAVSKASMKDALKHGWMKGKPRPGSCCPPHVGVSSLEVNQPLSVVPGEEEAETELGHLTWQWLSTHMAAHMLSPRTFTLHGNFHLNAWHNWLLWGP